MSDNFILFYFICNFIWIYCIKFELWVWYVGTAIFSDWGTIKQGVSQRSFPRPLLFVIYMNDLPPKINALSEPIIFTDDTSVDDFSSASNSFLSHMSKWLTASKLVLNVDQVNIVNSIWSWSCQHSMFSDKDDVYWHQTFSAVYHVDLQVW